MIGPRLRVFFTLTLLLAGCRGGAKGATTAPAPGETAAPPDADAVRAVDFNQLATFQTLLRQTGGQLEPRAIVYADVTGDGREEAIVPVTSGGTLGNLAYQVYTLRGGVAAPILTATRDAGTAGGVVLSVEDGKLIRTTGKYGPADPRCCPSVLVKTYYRWDGVNLQVGREEELPASPSQKTKD